MSLHPKPFDTIPEETKRVAHAAFPKGNLYLSLRDTLSPFYKDEDFASLFSPYGQPAEAPWRLALVCIFQFLEHLPDRQAAEAVRSRIDWKYVLAFPLDDSGFHFSVLGKFRARLLAGSAETQLLELLLEHLKAQKLLKARGQQRTDSTHIIAAIRSLNRLECVGETLRAALNALATHAPDWLSSIAPSEWFDRYSTRIEESRLPKGEEARREYGNLIGADGSYLLTALFADTSLAALRVLPAVKNLQRTWLYHYYAEEGHLRWRQAKDLPPAGMRFDSAYDPEARYGNKRSMTWTGYTRPFDGNV